MNGRKRLKYAEITKVLLGMCLAKQKICIKFFIFPQTKVNLYFSRLEEEIFPVNEIYV